MGKDSKYRDWRKDKPTLYPRPWRYAVTNGFPDVKDANGETVCCASEAMKKFIIRRVNKEVNMGKDKQKKVTNAYLAVIEQGASLALATALARYLERGRG